MSVAYQSTDTSWRLPGCGERCRRYYVVFPGQTYSEWVIVHDPHRHEAFGADAERHRLVSAPEVSHLVTGALEIDGPSEIVRVHGQVVALTASEAGLLLYLASRIGQVCAAIDVLRAVWGPDYAASFVRRPYGPHRDPHAQTLRVNVSRLRAKLGSERRLVQTAKNRGYRLLGVPPEGAP